MKKNMKKENYDKSNYSKKDTNIIKEFVVKKPCLLMDFLMENLTSLSRNNIKSLLSNLYHQIYIITFILSNLYYKN